MPKPKVKTKKSKVGSMKVWVLTVDNRISSVHWTKASAELVIMRNDILRMLNESKSLLIEIIPAIITPLSKSSKAK